MPTPKTNSQTNSPADAKSNASSKPGAGEEATQTVESTGGLPAAQAGSTAEQLSAVSGNQAEAPVPWSSLIVGGILFTLFVGGMCGRTLQFVRAKDKA